MPAASQAGQHASHSQLLPPEVSASGTWIGRARSYPIFSPSWYRYRSLALLTGCLVACLILAAMIAAPLLSAPAMPIDWCNGAQVTAVFLLPLLALCQTGPGLAVLARRRALPRFETASLLAALLLGMVLSATLYAVLAALYEKPRHDAGNGVIVARFLPHIKFDLKLEDGTIRTYGGGRESLVRGEEMNAATRALQEANAAAGASPAPPGWAEKEAALSQEFQRASKDMEMLDTGRAEVPPARRKEIEQAFTRTMKEMGEHSESLALLGHDAGAQRAPTPQQNAAGARVTAIMARLASPLGSPPVRQQDLVSREVGKAAIVVVAIGCLLLLSWLGGLVDLLTFVRQRGKLADVLAEKELERTRAARRPYRRPHGGLPALLDTADARRRRALLPGPDA